MPSAKHDDAALGAALLSRARNAIAEALGLPTGAEPRHPALPRPGATFVTLRRGGELRGCVGTLAAERPLADDVRVHALAAAFRDPRFEPLQVEEFAAARDRGLAARAGAAAAARSEAEAHAALRPGVDGVMLEWRGRTRHLPAAGVGAVAAAGASSSPRSSARPGCAADFWADDLRLSRYRVRKFVQAREHAHERARATWCRLMRIPARWWHRLDDGRMQCDLCPRDCRLHEGQRGLCFVRQRVGDEMVLTTYGRSSGFCIDPIEKKPLNHFYPGSSVFSFGTAGCNLACKFCQNWDISKSREMDRLLDAASPERIAEVALRQRLQERGLHLQRPGDLRRVRDGHRRRLPCAAACRRWR